MSVSIYEYQFGISVSIYEYQFGIFVEADSEQDASETICKVFKELKRIDVEGDCVLGVPRLLSNREASEVMRKPMKTGRLKLL